MESGGSLGRGAAGADDTDEIVSVVRTVESASESAEVETFQHPASTADNLDELARFDVEGEGYRQVGEIYGEPVPAGGWVETEDGEAYPIVSRNESLHDSSDLGDAAAHQLADSDSPPPLAPEQPGAEPSSGAGTAAPGPERRQPPPLDMTEPGAEGYDFRKSYGSVHDRNQFYRQEMNLRGNFFTREYLSEIDSRAVELFTDLGGNTDDIVIDNFGLRTSSAYDNLEQMAREADEAGNVSRAAEIRGAMAEIEEMTNGTIIELAARTDEFSGAAIGSQRAPIDTNIDVEKLRGWLQEQEAQARVKFAGFMAAGDPEAAELAGWERGYYDQLIRMLDENVNPLAYSNEQIVFVRNNKVDPYYAQFADEVAATAAEGYELVIPRPKAEDELDLYIELQQLLVATLSDPEFFRSAEDWGVDAFPPAVRARIEAGLDFLGPASLRPLAGGEVAPPLPAADLADSVGYVDEVRDRSFSRSALAASEETLERQAASLGDGGASVRGCTPDAGSAFAEPSLGSRAPADNARAPRIDGRSGQWIVEPSGETTASPTPAHDTFSLAQGDGVSSQASGVSWESGLQVPGDSGVGAAASDADTSDLFRAASEPEDVSPEDVEQMRHAPAVNGDGLSGSPGVRSEGTGPEGREPVRHRRGAGRIRRVRPRQRDRTGCFGHPFAHHRGHPRSGAHRLRTGRGGHQRNAFRRLGARCAHERRRPSCGPLRRARVLRGTLARGCAPVRRPEGAGPVARRWCGRSRRGPRSRRARRGRPREEVHSQEPRRQARLRFPQRRGRYGARDSPRAGRGQHALVQRRHRQRGQRLGRHPVERRAQSHRGGARGQRPLVRVRRDAAHIVRLLQRRPAPAPVSRRRACEHRRPRPRGALRPEAPERGAGTRDRIRPALAGVERVPVLAARAHREHAFEGRVPET